ncbi:MAG TPA: hypothetical protein VLG09_04345 [Candidatus Saccharimonadales bacterium]|nr:hypothetical protein [Candidatus Saccharimonadales bacterium]
MDDQTPRQPQAQPQSPPRPPELTPVMPEAQLPPPSQFDVEPTTSPVSPIPTSTPAPSMPLPPLGHEDIFIPPFTQPVAPKKSKKRLVIILAAILTLLLGGGVSVYALWYQNPEKVITDGVLHAIQAKSMEYTGTLSMETGTYKTKVEITGADVSDAHRVAVKMTIPEPFSGDEIPFDGEGVFDAKGDLYVKVKNVDQMISPYRGFFGTAAQKSLDKIITKINNKWVKISATDLAGLSQVASKTQTCTAEVIKKYANDSSAVSEITDAYKKNRFIIVDQNLGTKDGSLGYTMKSDETKAKAFVEAVKTTKIYTAIHECDNSFTLNSYDVTIAPDDTNSTAHAEIWVSQWTHQITKISTSATIPNGDDTPESKIGTNFEPRFNTGVAISAPEASTTLGELKADIEKLFKDAQAEYMAENQLKA